MSLKTKIRNAVKREEGIEDAKYFQESRKKFFMDNPFNVPAQNLKRVVINPVTGNGTITDKEGNIRDIHLSEKAQETFYRKFFSQHKTPSFEDETAQQFAKDHWDEIRKM